MACIRPQVLHNNTLLHHTAPLILGILCFVVSLVFTGNCIQLISNISRTFFTAHIRHVITENTQGQLITQIQTLDGTTVGRCKICFTRKSENGLLTYYRLPSRVCHDLIYSLVTSNHFFISIHSPESWGVFSWEVSSHSQCSSCCQCPVRKKKSIRLHIKVSRCQVWWLIKWESGQYVWKGTISPHLS